MVARLVPVLPFTAVNHASGCALCSPRRSQPTQRWRRTPPDVFLPAATTGLPKDSLVNVTQLVTVDRQDIDDQAAEEVPTDLMVDVDAGVRLVLRS